MISETELVTLTRQSLPEWPDVATLEPILKGGSDRCFYRVHFAGNAHVPVILMTYTLVRSDNPRFVAATYRLTNLGVQVPSIYAHDTEKLCVWVEDLGSTDLHAFRNEAWSVREPLYRSALEQAAKLHQVDTALLAPEDLAEMELCFDEKLYEWEQNYFLTHYIQGIKASQLGEITLSETVTDALVEVRQRLAQLPRGLVHRDFQSQNVIIRRGSAWLIDYQGVRPGLAEYDLASLLLDPYVNLTEAERDSLLKWYADHTGKHFAEMMDTYWLCSAQRLMQAIGAYANLSRNLGKPHFEQHIPVALERLRVVCNRHPLLAPLLEIIS